MWWGRITDRSGWRWREIGVENVNPSHDVRGRCFHFRGGRKAVPIRPCHTSAAASTSFGVLEGIKVAIAPALTDAPIILVAVLLMGQLAKFEAVLGIISLLGAAFLLYLAFESFRVRGIEIDETKIEPRSISKGFMANLLNPHPYLFWFVVGAPKLVEAAEISQITAVAFIAGLYTCLIGVKILVAFLVGRSRAFLKSRGYVYVNRILGAVLAGFAVLFLRDGLRFLDVVP